MSQETINVTNISGEIQPIRLRKGDTLIVMLDNEVRIPDAHLLAIRDQFNEHFPHNDVIIMDTQAHFSVIRTGEQPFEDSDAQPGAYFDAMSERVI